MLRARIVAIPATRTMVGQLRLVPALLLIQPFAGPEEPKRAVRQKLGRRL